MRLDLVAILIFSISGLVMSGLQANQHFLLPALAPILYNLGQIFGVTILLLARDCTLARFTCQPLGLDLRGWCTGSSWGRGCILIRFLAWIHYHYRWKPIIGLNSTGSGGYCFC